MRALDHLVMPTADLAIARGRLSSLGFTVAPQGNHPFGTINACIYFADGTFIEPLAIGDRAVVDKAIADGNNFVQSDRRFRAAGGDEGLSGLVFATMDAEADDREFREAGISGGPMVEFSRPSMDARGRSDIASFLLAFAGTPAAPDLHFFACERRKAPKIDRGELERHENGAKAIASVVMTSPRAKEMAEFLAKAARSKVNAEVGKLSVPLAGCNIQVREHREASSARFHALVFHLEDISAAETIFTERGIVYEAHSDGAIRVPAAPGQGVDFIFEELP
jgi:hypothetical protein